MKLEIPPDMVVNVGIKHSQKEKIVELITNIDRYKSINEFVQEAVQNAILVEAKKLETSTQRNHKFIIIFNRIKEINLKLLSDELLGHHKLTTSIIHRIQMVQQTLPRFESVYQYNPDDRMQIFLEARQLKENLDDHINHLVQGNQSGNLKISEYLISELRSLRDEFISLIAQEVKG